MLLGMHGCQSGPLTDRKAAGIRLIFSTSICLCRIYLVNPGNI